MKLRTHNSRVPHVVHDGTVETKNIGGRFLETATTACGRVFDWFTSEENIREFFENGKRYSRKCQKCFPEE